MIRNTDAARESGSCTCFESRAGLLGVGFDWGIIYRGSYKHKRVCAGDQWCHLALLRSASSRVRFENEQNQDIPLRGGVGSSGAKSVSQRLVGIARIRSSFKTTLGVKYEPH